MSSGTPETWRPVKLPADQEAANRINEWLERKGKLYAIELDLRGSDFSGGDFSESWLTQANLVDVPLCGAEFYRADLEGADLTGADLTAASLVRANLDDAVLQNAQLSGADMVKASLYGVDASGASFRGARLMDASLSSVDLRGADLTDVKLDETILKATVDEHTVVRGMSGTVFGRLSVHVGEEVEELRLVEMADWLNSRGANVDVLAPRGPRSSK